MVIWLPCLKRAETSILPIFYFKLHNKQEAECVAVIQGTIRLETKYTRTYNIYHRETNHRRSTALERFVLDYREPSSSFTGSKSRKENPQKLTQLSSRSHPRHLVGKRTAKKDIIIDITSDSQVNSNFPYRWSPASLTFNNYFYLFLMFIYNMNNHK